jgi:hypothetical protein
MCRGSWRSRQTSTTPKNALSGQTLPPPPLLVFSTTTAPLCG